MSVPAKSHLWFEVQLTVFVSFLAWPLLYMLETAFRTVSKGLLTFVMLIVGTFVLVVPLFLFIRLTKLKHWVGYVFMVFAFTAMIDLIIALEYWNFISGFITTYLEMGEPYLNCPWGCVICLFDGVGLYWMYLLLIYQISNGKSWRSSGIYYTSAITNSMLVYMIGIFAGKHEPTYCTFLNLPYAIIPFWEFCRLLSTPDDKGKEWSKIGRKTGFFGIVVDLMLVLGFLMCIWISFAKSMVALGSNLSIFENFGKSEPLLLNQDPAPYAQVQSFAYLFYLLPIQGISIFYIFRKKIPHFVWDLACIQAGVVLQAQFTIIIASLDPKAHPAMTSDIYDQVFWFNNLTLLVVPQVYLWVLYNRHYGPKIGNKTK